MTTEQLHTGLSTGPPAISSQDKGVQREEVSGLRPDPSKGRKVHKGPKGAQTSNQVPDAQGPDSL